MHIYLWVGFVLFLAGFTNGLSGFGVALLAIPLLAILLDVKTVVPLVALAGLTTHIIVLVQLRHHFDWNKILPLILSAIPGVAVGALFLKHLDRAIILYILGILLIVYSVYSLFLRIPVRDLKKGWVYPFGFLAGVLGGALSAQGPPVIVYTSMQAWSKDQIKVTLQGFFILSGIIVILFHILNGITTLYVLKLYGTSIPMLFIGTYIGSLFYGRIQEEGYRKLVLIILLVLGAFMIYKA